MQILPLAGQSDIPSRSLGATEVAAGELGRDGELASGEDGGGSVPTSAELDDVVNDATTHRMVGQLS